jgi:predicted GNAT family acetyltransferase
MNVTIDDEPDASRFLVRADGAPAGEITYVVRHGRRLIVHTGIESAFEGRGVGSGAAVALLEDVRSRGEQIVPLCPFVRRYIERHPGYDDLVDHELLAAYDRSADH